MVHTISKHPWDWLFHAGLNFIAVYFGWINPLLAIGIDIYLEYEQKSQVWYEVFSWKNYFIYHSLGDIVADILGIGLALLLRR